jgi:multidrug efflux system membrane fusion protein
MPRLLVTGITLALAVSSCSDPAPPGDGGTARVVPVAAATVTRRDVPIYLDGLGTAVAQKTIAVHAQVDGQLMRVLFREGDRVRRGQLLGLVDPRPFQAQLHQAQGALARDRALYRSSRLNYDRLVELRRRQLVAQQNVDDQEALVGQYQGAIQLDLGQIETARLNLKYARVTSPVDGVAGLRLIDPGNIVHAADPNGIVVLTEIDPIAVLITLPQDDLSAVSQAMGERAPPVEIFSRDGEAPIGVGTVAAVDNQVNLTTATIRLKALVPNRERRIWPNQFIKARVRVATRARALVVPATAIQRGPEGIFAYVITPDGTVAMRKVELDLTMGDLSIVRAGLEEGERVVTEGQNQLSPGARVSVRQEATVSEGTR